MRHFGLQAIPQVQSDMLCVVDTVFSGRLLCRRNVHNAMANVHVEGVAVFYKQGFGSTGGEGERKGLQGGWGV